MVSEPYVTHYFILYPVVSTREFCGHCVSFRSLTGGGAAFTVHLVHRKGGRAQVGIGIDRERERERERERGPSPISLFIAFGLWFVYYNK